MVKRQKEKQYQSASENRQNAQIRSGTDVLGSSRGVVQRRLPFHCCALTLNPFTHPVCTASGNGIILESTALVDFIMKHHKDPITGLPMTTKDIITLHMDQDDEGRWQCPILTKPFSDHTKVVAVVDRSCHEAYVYSYEAYKELNVKTKNWLDLTTGKKFDPKNDVVILNDPDQETDQEFQKRRDIQSFWYITSGRSQVALDEQNTSQKSNNVKHSVTAMRVLEQLQKEKEVEDKKKKKRQQQQQQIDASMNGAGTTKKLKIYSEDVTGVQYTSGKAAGSLTSSAVDVSHANEAREASTEEILQAQFKVMKSRKEKGYVRMITNLGDLLLELHCDIVPRTCTNFLGHCQAKNYDGTSFHRLIPSFMIQGGKAMNGEDASIWGPSSSFVDEFDDRLKHTGSGILSMANAGPGTNKQQFFITFKSCPHLDRKHSIFGEVVDGKAVLDKMQKIPTDKKDRPLETVTILRMEILVDPAKEAQEFEEQRLQELAQAREKKEGEARRRITGKMGTASSLESLQTSGKANSTTSGIGKYLSATAVKVPEDDGPSNDKGSSELLVLPPPVKQKSTVKATKFGDFSSW